MRFLFSSPLSPLLWTSKSYNGELDFVSIFNGRFNFYLNLVGVNFFKETLSSRLALMKVLPFSLQNKFRSFLCAQNWREAKIKQSVDKLFTNSKQATMMSRHVKSPTQRSVSHVLVFQYYFVTTGLK